MFSTGVPTPPLFVSDGDAQLLTKAAELADTSAGFTAPHPNSACLLFNGNDIVGRGVLYGQGTTSAEVQACRSAGERANGCTAYLNLEPGDCHGDDSAIYALKQAGVSRVVVGIPHPLQHFRGKAIKELRKANIVVDVLGENLPKNTSTEQALKACHYVNAPLLYRSSLRCPMSTLKYAMTLDGKIAASTGHAAWVSSKASRQRVFATRGRSDAIIVGGNTVRRDNPKLTTRQEGGHLPARIVMSRCMHLPEDAHLWDVSSTPTIVMTQRGARKDFQQRLEKKGVEIVEFDFLTPKAVMEYCYDRGFLSVLWECGGTLAAPALTSGVIHKVIAFVAPKIIGGTTAPSPVGDMGMVEMTQALNLADVSFEKIGPDMLITGYLQPIPDLRLQVPDGLDELSATEAASFEEKPTIICFYKAWDAMGAFSNFSPHAIDIGNSEGGAVQWTSVEHYYQAQKFTGVQDTLALNHIEQIQSAESPEEAARIGRTLAKQRPDLVRSDWEGVKLEVMYTGLRAKFSKSGWRRS
ncbi:hypothetical protein GOP47_0016504 [Adiantum capillus-veneris]|uniref:5-amino-6-(5-phosphoribosylamino)uracil reductase n=1 Tax=Adiantum capillus-veneris TaxID=13818 RepID=A0A9D4UIL5_ADICA|nr:hypothetical protein GOP47_0016504 [Adiantum capillus-veneris]